ncbi:MAG: crotonase/enoyl-CoA hydratase family protein [Acidimicrobiales bacterium]
MSFTPTQLTYDVSDRIATITLNRPDKLNAFTSRMVHEMLAALDAADEDDEVRAIIITGAGRGFCAGADMSAGADTFEKTSGADMADDDPSGLKNRDGGGIVSLRIFNSLKPVIGAVNGPAVGVGSTMLLPMDIRLASTKARFGFVFSQRGIVPEAASSWFLPRVVGISTALEWCFSGRVFEADEALASGLVRSLHEPEDLLPAARAIASQIAENTSAVSVTMARHQLWRMLGESHPMAAHRIESKAVPQLGAGADAIEGVTSFFEKRPPNFTMGPSRDMPDVFPWWTEPEFHEPEE